MTSQYLPPNPDALKRIKHIVVLMMENHSFDNILGWLYDGEQPPRGQQFEGLHSGLWNPLDNIDSDGLPFTEQVYVRKNGDSVKSQTHKTIPKPVDYTLPDPDPGEGFKDTNYQLFGQYNVAQEYPPKPTNLGFVNNYAKAMLYGTYVYGDEPTDPRDIMACYTPEQTPVLSGLAKNFAVCDQWFASVPSQTLPNRDFIHAATSTGLVNNDPISSCDARTIFNKIEDAIQNDGRSDLSWRVYSGMSDGKPFSLTRLMMTQLHDFSFDANFLNIKDFYTDAKNGSLPSYAFLEPQFSEPGQNDQHPPTDIRWGEKLIADVYNAVITSPQWNETLLVITYDEHGGCYDHFAPPQATAPTGIGNPHQKGFVPTPGQDGFTFDRFGVRVPTVLISPYIETGTIARPSGYTPFDHTSVLATIQKCFDLGGHLTYRDADAPDLSCVLTLDTPRSDQPVITPAPGTYAKPDLEHVNSLHRTMENRLSQLTGTSRPEGTKVLKFLADKYAEHFRAKKTTRKRND